MKKRFLVTVEWDIENDPARPYDPTGATRVRKGIESEFPPDARVVVDPENSGTETRRLTPEQAEELTRRAL